MGEVRKVSLVEIFCVLATCSSSNAWIPDNLDGPVRQQEAHGAHDDDYKDGYSCSRHSSTPTRLTSLHKAGTLTDGEATQNHARLWPWDN